jgi:hypothetical protein
MTDTNVFELFQPATFLRSSNRDLRKGAFEQQINLGILHVANASRPHGPQVGGHPAGDDRSNQVAEPGR